MGCISFMSYQTHCPCFLCRHNFSCVTSLCVFLLLQAAELAPALQADMEVKEAIQGAIQGENGEVVQIVTSVATWEIRLVQRSPALYAKASPNQSWWNIKGYNCSQPEKLSSWNSFLTNTWWNTRKKHFPFLFFTFLFSQQTAQFVANQMSPCGNVLWELEKTLIGQNQLWSFCCFHHQKDPALHRIHSGIIICSRRPSACHFISRDACLHQPWKTVKLFGVKILG